MGSLICRDICIGKTIARSARLGRLQTVLSDYGEAGFLRAAAGATGVPGMQLMLPMVLGPYWTKPVDVVGECGAEIGR